MMKYKSFKLNNNSYVHIRIRKNVDEVCKLLNMKTGYNFKCKNINDEYYGFLIFLSDKVAYICTKEGFYSLSIINKFSNLDNDVECLLKVIFDDLEWLSFDLEGFKNL